jgi:carbon monoxide dehydrogenase subunit G
MMASIHTETSIAAPAEAVWAALRDVGNAHLLFRGVLVNARLEGDDRIVTFADGTVVKERIIAVDDQRRRLAYSAVRAGLAHHSASMQVFAEGPASSRLVWITDVLPDEVAASVGPAIDQGTAAANRTLEGLGRRGDR